MDDFIPYGRQAIDDDDIQAVIDVLKSDWLTTGPAVSAFEKAFTDVTGTRFATAVSNGTAALHAAMFALDIKPGDEVIVPAITFAASANAVLYQGGTPVFADVDPDTLLIDPASIDECVTEKTRAVVAVDYAGQPCDYDQIRPLCDQHGLKLVVDACHALGASYKGRPAGVIGDINVFSFHPVKHITTGEGGMVATDKPEYDEKVKIFRNHGITADNRQRALQGKWFYEMTALGYNYRLSDIQCALGLSQLKKLPQWIKKRREVADRYDRLFSHSDMIHPLAVRPDVEHAYHLYVVQIDVDRGGVFTIMRQAGIGVNVHYIPVYLHPYYRDLGYKTGLCPKAEAAYGRILTLPMFPGLGDEQIQRTAATLAGAVDHLRNG